MAEDAAGRAVGYGRINHIPWEFHPQTYYLNVTVDPALRRRGIGSAIYDALLGELQRRGALAVRSGVAKETMTESVAFLTRRGFAEVQRGCESRLDVPAFDVARFAGAEERSCTYPCIVTRPQDKRHLTNDPCSPSYELQQACG